MHVFTYHEALASGRTPAQVRRLVDRGLWRTLGRGVLCAGETWEVTAADPKARHLLLTTGALLGRPDAVASHGSAATVFGWPTSRSMRAAVHLTVPPPVRTRRGRVVLHAAALPAADRVVERGIACTAPPRTLVDIARTYELGASVAAGDAALRSGRVSQGQLLKALDDCHGWPGSRRVAPVLALLDGRRETPLESWSAVMFHGQGVPQPTPQYELRDDNGAVWARVDFLWERQGVVGEADGRGKYNGADGEQVLWAEKRREDRLRDLGFRVVRWGWEDVQLRPQQTCARILAVLALGSSSRSA